MNNNGFWHVSVFDFNRNVLGIDRRTLGPMPVQEARHLNDACIEEISEFTTAYHDQDFIGQVDALVDLVYFAIGGLYKMGLTEETAHEIFHLIHSKNVLKKLGKVAHRGHDGVPDAIKPEGWTGPERAIGEILDRQA
jgi:predicted HAD superfamily Cof-like phosphohydrolase